MLSDTRERAARLLAGMSFSNPFVRVVMIMFMLRIVFTAAMVKIARMCWTAARDMPGQELTIYSAGCLATGVCFAVLFEGTRPWVTGEPSSFAGFVTGSLATSLPIGIIALPIVFILFVTSSR